MREVECPKDQAVVLLTEEYGYREWIWWTGMSSEQLVEWWEKLASVNPYFFDPRSLPGKLIPRLGDSERGPGKVQRYVTYDPETFSCEGDKPQGEEIAILHSESLWHGHIHCDDDSALSHETHGRILHAGFGEDEEDDDVRT